MIAKGNFMLAVAAATLAFGFAIPSAHAGIFTLKSSTFSEGQIMPKKVAQSQANAPSNPNCVGENVSPQLSWTNVPDGTKSFVIYFIDPEARGVGFDQWIAYGIPASVTGFAEGEVSKPSDKYVGGKNTLGSAVYSGPCTPPNSMPHHYVFVLIATDLDPKDLPPGMSRTEVNEKLGLPPNSHVMGVAGLAGRFVNPWQQ
jgi:hypothetical protein